MKSLTLTQPWATLMAQGNKTIETRSWASLYRGPLAIHAGKSLPKYARAMAEDIHDFPEDFNDVTISPVEGLPRGCVVAVCRLVEIGPTDHVSLEHIRREGQLGDYTPHRFAWYTGEVLMLPEPIPATGSLGLWEWDVPFDTQRWLAIHKWPPGVVYG